MQGAANKQLDISLCREYRLEVTVPTNRAIELISAFGQCRTFYKNAESFEIRKFKDFLKMKPSQNPFTDFEILSCLNEMENGATS